MTISDTLSQYRNIVSEVLISNAKIRKSFKTFIIDVMILYMVIPRRINFTQMEHFCFGKRCEQTFRNNFRKKFDWMWFNTELSKRIYDAADKVAIAVDPSFITKSGNHTPWVGYFWSGCASASKKGLEILGIGLLNISKHLCMNLRAGQTPNTGTLSTCKSTLIDWYITVIKIYRKQLLKLSGYIVADAYFSKKTFADAMRGFGFHLISRFRSDANLWYIYQGKGTGRRGRPKVLDGKIDFYNPDFRRMKKINIESEEGTFYTLIAYSKALKCKVRLAIWFEPNGKHKLFFSTDTQMSGLDVVQYYRTRFQLEFCYRDAKGFTGLCHCQARDIHKLDFAFNASLAAANVAKVMIYRSENKLSMGTIKSLIYNSFVLQRFIAVSGYKPNCNKIKMLIAELRSLSRVAA